MQAKWFNFYRYLLKNSVAAAGYFFYILKDQLQ